ncbi:MAG: glycosyltransferase [Candidatus Brocadiia bacterium]
MSQESVSVVIPVYNEEANIPQLWSRISEVMNKMGCEWETIFVDDGSFDRSLEMLRLIASESGGKAVVVELAHNSGQHPAVFAGMSQAKGDIVVTIDADLQNPPEEIPRLIEALRVNNWEVCGSIRVSRQDSLFRKLASSIVARMAQKMTKTNLTDWGSMLRAFRRPVIQRMLDHPEHSTYIPALATLYSKRVGEIPTSHEERAAGKSNYSLKKLLDLYFDLLTSFSDAPLKVMFYVGVFLAFAGIMLAGVLMFGRLILGDQWAAEGVFTLFSLLFFFIGSQFFALGLLGQYISRIYREVRKRPSYVIREVFRGK